MYQKRSKVRGFDKHITGYLFEDLMELFDSLDTFLEKSKDYAENNKFILTHNILVPGDVKGFILEIVIIK